MTLEPRPAATIVLVRQSGGGPEVLLVQRPAASAFGAGAWVFPGGAVDPEDSAIAELLPDVVSQLGPRMALDPVTAGSYLGAALREAWEETGILPGAGSSRRVAASELERTLSVTRLLAREAEPPDLTRVVYLSRWVTPPGQSRRYDTRFFLAEVGDRVEVSLNEAELSASRWTSARLALERHEAGEMVMMPPTVHTLRSLARYSTVTGMLKDLREMVPGSYLPDSADDALRQELPERLAPTFEITRSNEEER